MYNAKYVIAGIIVFLAIMTSPMWYNLASGEVTPPELATPKGEHCVEDAKWMEANHMELLKEWRTINIRDGQLIYISKAYGEPYETTIYQCWECHESKAEFCDKCHEYTGVKPYCFECHNTPEIVKEYNE
ncbi:sulfate reduction electron transfer complex DsrMKJOP subunit DsrJ [Archaeoglobus veneficus]|uniref:Sulfur reduction protein DsrJ n=1 Tax=Archaeoglobus veneficus (strain DSM 11195 / SNP6) TaxID=693661 RepID=F2KQF3_ARCVS|nr:sulfate reduction electron transfer complex DsrMKJOP subunit DsrJ [Archaeoglobus veneficus]AEA47686.1 hypothetical protein Arcve_1687 [Archaeoglobus veneficus SNP6]